MIHRTFHRFVGLLWLVVIITAGVAPVQAGAGALDSTFSTDGKVTTDFGGRGDFGYSMALQPDGKIVVAGGSSDYSQPCCNHDIALARYNDDGSLDTSFDADGKVITGFGGNVYGNTHEVANSVALQPDGKIVVAGYSASFSSSGGNADFALVRYNSNGSLDTTFHMDGRLTTDFGNSDEGGAAVLIQPDGKILVAGRHFDGTSNNFALARYNPNGSLDTTFDMDGKVTTDIGGFADSGEAMVLQSNGKVLVAGHSNNGTDIDFALVRYNSDGSLDTTFDNDGKLTTDFGFDDYGDSLLLQANDRIIVVGNSSSNDGDNYDRALARYTSNGLLDPTFDLDGQIIPVVGSNSYESASAAALQPDGKIFVTGRTGSGSDFALIRYNSDGSLDPTFGTNGKVTTSIGVSEDYAEAIALKPDGKVIVAGESDGVSTDYNFALVRYSSNQTHALSVTIAGNGEVTSAPAGISCGGDCFESYTSGTSVTLTAMPGSNAAFTGWSGACSGNGACIVTITAARSVTANFAIMPTNTDLYFGNTRYARYYIPPHGIRQASIRLSRGPVRLINTENNPMMAAERMIYKVNGVDTSFSEMMGLPQGQLDTIFWLPWYNNVDLDTQLRIANVSGLQATVTVTIGGAAQPSFSLAAGASTRLSYAGVNSGPVKIVSTQNIVAAQRVIYKVNGTNTSFSEMMALPQKGLDQVYYLPWYNNVDLDTQLRIANVGGLPATVTVTIGSVAQPSFNLAAGVSTRLSYPVNNGPVKIESTQDIVAAERVIYKVNNVNTSFSETMALPASQLDSTYWFPWYNNVDLDAQLRIANISSSQATVTVTIGGVAQPSFTLAAGASTRVSYPVNNGPVKIESTQNIVAAERVIYKVSGIPTSFSEMMGLPNVLLDMTYWLPWYNNVDLDTQLRFGLP
jgi:uncharacterized delta-60 repeat protein